MPSFLDQLFGNDQEEETSPTLVDRLNKKPKTSEVKPTPTTAVPELKPKDKPKPQAPAEPPKPPRIESLKQSYDDKLNLLSNRINSLDAESQDLFTEKYEKLRNQYNKAKESNEWGEFAERIGHALAQLGAGYYGLKTGVNMAGLKFNKVNWEKRQDRLLNELRTDLSALEKEEGIQRDKQVRGLRAREAELSAIGRAIGQELQEEQRRMVGQTSSGEERRKLAKAKAKQFDKAIDNIQQIFKQKKVDNREELVQSELIQLGVSPEEAEKITVESGWIWDSPRDVHQIVNDLQILKQRTLEDTEPPSMVTIITPTGQRGQIPRANLPDAISKGAKVVE